MRCGSAPSSSPAGCAGSLRAAVTVFLLGGALVLLGGAALVSVFGSPPASASSAAFVFDAMLADVGRLADGPAVAAPCGCELVIGLAGAAVVVARGHAAVPRPA